MAAATALLDIAGSPGGRTNSSPTSLLRRDTSTTLLGSTTTPLSTPATFSSMSGTLPTSNIPPSSTASRSTLAPTATPSPPSITSPASPTSPRNVPTDQITTTTPLPSPPGSPEQTSSSISLSEFPATTTPNIASPVVSVSVSRTQSGPAGASISRTPLPGSSRNYRSPSSTSNARAAPPSTTNSPGTDSSPDFTNPGAQNAPDGSHRSGKTRGNIVTIAAVVGSLGFLLVILLALFFFYRRWLRRRFTQSRQGLRPDSVKSWVQFEQSRHASVANADGFWEVHGYRDSVADAAPPHIPDGMRQFTQLNVVQSQIQPQELLIPELAHLIDHPSSSALSPTASHADITPFASQVSLLHPRVASPGRTMSPLVTELDHFRLASPAMLTPSPLTSLGSPYVLPSPGALPSTEGPAQAVQGLTFPQPRPNQDLAPISTSFAEPEWRGFAMFQDSPHSHSTQDFLSSNPSWPPTPHPYGGEILPASTSILERPGPQLSMPREVGPSHHVSLNPMSGSVGEIYMDTDRPTLEMLQEIGRDSTALRTPANPFQDSTDSTALGSAAGLNSLQSPWTYRAM